MPIKLFAPTLECSNLILAKPIELTLVAEIWKEELRKENQTLLAGQVRRRDEKIHPLRVYLPEELNWAYFVGAGAFLTLTNFKLNHLAFV